MDDIYIYSSGTDDTDNKAAAPQSAGFWGFSGFLDSVKQTATAAIEKASHLVEEAKQSLPETTHSVIETYKRDLSEFVNTVKHEVSEKAQRVAPLAGLARADSDEDMERNLPSAPVDHLDHGIGLEARLRALQCDVNTFRQAISSPAFPEWKLSFDLATATDKISSLLVQNPLLQQIHTRLVPQELPYEVFWERYFFRAHLIEEEEARRAALLERVATTAQQEEEIGWDFDDDIDIAESRSDQQKTTQHVPIKTSSQGDVSTTTSSILDAPVPISPNRLFDTNAVTPPQVSPRELHLNESHDEPVPLTEEQIAARDAALAFAETIRAQSKVDTEENVQEHGIPEKPNPVIVEQEVEDDSVPALPVATSLSTQASPASAERGESNRSSGSVSTADTDGSWERVQEPEQSPAAEQANSVQRVPVSTVTAVSEMTTTEPTVKKDEDDWGDWQ